MVATDPGRCHVCPPLPGAAAGSVGSARWRAAVRDSAKAGEVGLATSPDAFPNVLALGEGSPGWQGRWDPLRFPFPDLSALSGVRGGETGRRE